MLNFRAIWTGFLIDIGATFVFTAALLLAFLDPGSAEVCMGERLQGTGIFETSLMLLGLLATAMGAFTAARMSLGREAIHSGAVGVCSFAFSLWTCGGAQAFSDPYFTFGMGMLMPAAFLGGAAATITRLREMARD